MEEIDSPNLEGSRTGYSGSSFEDVEALFVRELARRRKIAWFAEWSGFIFLTVALLWAVIWLVGKFTGAKVSWPWPISGLQSISVLTWIVASRLSKNAVKFIDSAVDKRAVGPLLDMQAIRDQRYGYDESMRQLAIPVLARLLPEITENDDAVLNVIRRRVLGSLMLEQSDGEFVLAAIDALSRTGREEVIRSIEDVMNGKAKYIGKDAQDAARQALIRVQHRTELEKAHASLLRPSESASDLNPSLLRPADGAATFDSNTLLHPSNESETLTQQA